MGFIVVYGQLDDRSIKKSKLILGIIIFIDCFFLYH